MNHYKLAIFDMDGTILDTLDDLADATNYCLAAYKMPLRTVAEVRQFVGNGIHKLIERAVPAGTTEELIEEIYHTFLPYYKEHCFDKTRPYPGITELFGKLHREKCLVAVVSNKADMAVQELCSRYFPGMVDYAVGEKEGVRRKPWPDTVFTAIDALKASPEEAVYVGDSDVDIETARNSGLDHIIVTWGFREKKFLEEKGGKVFADHAKELEELL